ncbi:MAG: GNAT family N-acetyltransferase [Caulobacter sp.]|nr:GNAT family N-acetyltransferase [Caulobacter sp.]
MSVHIRQASRTNAALFPAIERSAGEAFRAIPDLAWIADDAVTPAEDYFPAIAAGTVWEAVEGETPVGFVLGEVVCDALHIWELAVAQAHQQQGLGRRLMQAAEDWARDRGLAALTLTTFSTVPWNGPFYSRLGYQRLETPLPEVLQTLIEAETARGLKDRCAMRLTL